MISIWLQRKTKRNKKPCKSDDENIGKLIRLILTTPRLVNLLIHPEMTYTNCFVYHETWNNWGVSLLHEKKACKNNKRCIVQWLQWYYSVLLSNRNKTLIVNPERLDSTDLSAHFLGALLKFHVVSATRNSFTQFRIYVLFVLSFRNRRFSPQVLKGLRHRNFVDFWSKLPKNWC